MEVQNLLWKLLHEPGRKQPHVSGKTDQFDSMALECGDNFAIMLLAGLAFGGNHQRFQPTLPRHRNSGSLCLVGDHDGDTRVWNASGRDAVGDGDEVRSAPGEKNS